jgi:hypothetical protein
MPMHSPRSGPASADRSRRNRGSRPLLSTTPPEGSSHRPDKVVAGWGACPSRTNSHQFGSGRPGESEAQAPSLSGLSRFDLPDRRGCLRQTTQEQPHVLF